jgi:hypothetical protein
MRQDPAALAPARGLQHAAMRTTRVLGTHPGPTINADKQGDISTGLTGINRGQGNVEAQQARGRVNARFRIALTGDGRIVHLYGHGSELQRQVMNEQQSQNALAHNNTLANIAARRRGGHILGAGPGNQVYVNAGQRGPGEPNPTKLGQAPPVVTSRTNQPTTPAARRRARRSY